jgi:hypothetical protein
LFGLPSFSFFLLLIHSRVFFLYLFIYLFPWLLAKPNPSHWVLLSTASIHPYIHWMKLPLLAHSPSQPLLGSSIPHTPNVPPILRIPTKI